MKIETKKKLYKLILNTLMVSLLSSCTPSKNVNSNIVSGDGYMEYQGKVYTK